MKAKKQDRPQTVVRCIVLDGRGQVIGTADLRMDSDIAARMQRER